MFLDLKYLKQSPDISVMYNRNNELVNFIYCAYLMSY